MKSLASVAAALRRKNIGQYGLLAGCCFFSVLIITAYVTMMRSPTVLTVLPEGGDSRKQVMLVFALAVIGCGVFTTYASGLFFRYKSREMGIFMALGASKGSLRGVLTRELGLLALASCGAGAILGAPMALGIWQIFRAFIVDSEQMAFVFDPQAYLFALAFCVFIFVMLFVMMVRFLGRVNILDVVNESRKSESVRAIPRYYGWLGILLTILGCFLGYLMPSFFVLQMNWYPPEALTSVFFAPSLVGLYMILLHTVVNGWSSGKNRYKGLIATGMMQFQGRQTVRNMIVVTLLVAGAFFASFYAPLMSTGNAYAYQARSIDYLFNYRSDQDMPDEARIRAMADEMGVTITRYDAVSAAVLGIDGIKTAETKKGAMGTTYEEIYTELLQGDLFLSQSAYTTLTGEEVSVPKGSVYTVYDSDGQSGFVTSNELSIVTNAVTGEVLRVTPQEEVLKNDMLFRKRVLNDEDYALITEGLPAEWREESVAFDVQNVEQTYPFAKALFKEIVTRSSPEVEIFDAWDPVEKLVADREGQTYLYDADQLAQRGRSIISYDDMDSSDFRLYWKYMPQFRVMDQVEDSRTLAVFMMLFVFVAILCFAAVGVILFTRSMTVAMTNKKVYEDLEKLGASRAYLRQTVRSQISRVFFVPILTGTLLVGGFYSMILFFNDNRFSTKELLGSVNCLIIIAVVSVLLYALYRMTLAKVIRQLNIG